MPLLVPAELTRLPFRYNGFKCTAECVESNVYREELDEAEQQGRAAHAAMEAWVSRPIDAPDVPGAVLEGYAKELRASREVLQKLRSEHGTRDDIEEALARNEEYHRTLGLSVKDKPDPEAQAEPEDQDA